VAAVEPLLRRIVAEKLILLSSGGSDWIAGSGRAVHVEGGYSINARKIFTSGAPAGDLLMTGAVLEEDGQEPMVLHFGIPMTSPHVRIDPVWRTLGMRGTGSHDVLIEGHVIPETAVALKRKAGEWHPLFHTIATLAFPLVYAAYLGVAESACSIAIELARKRRADHNVTQLIGRMQTELAGAQMAHRHMVEAASCGTTSAETVNNVMIGKRLVTEHGIRAVEFAMEAAGGAGFYRSQGLERRFRDIQGARYHVLQAGPQATFAGSLALGLPVDKVF
jgi:alkylation response protein AidB-like acyl-CoA dehydrogenase